jgi:hypothetical protein
LWDQNGKSKTKIKNQGKRIPVGKTRSYLELEVDRRRPLLMQQYKKLAVPANLWNVELQHTA